MKELLSLDEVSLRDRGATLTLTVLEGQTIALMGPSCSGKTWLLRTISGQERPGQGRVQLHGLTTMATNEGVPKRSKIQSLVRGSMENEEESATDILYNFGLWESRSLTFGDLTPSSAAAVELLLALQSEADIVLIDGHLDRLDPWALAAARRRIRSETALGRSFIIATHRPDLVAAADGLIVLRDGEVRFAGSPTELLRMGSPQMLLVETDQQSGVRALVAPFEVTVKETESGLHLEARDGQALAARLLTEGYGDIKFVVLRETTLGEALQSL